jgi:hypothetical protein
MTCQNKNLWNLKLELESCKYTLIKLKILSPQNLLKAVCQSGGSKQLQATWGDHKWYDELAPTMWKFANKLRSITFMFTILRDTSVSELAQTHIICVCTKSNKMYSIVLWGASPYMQKVFFAQKRVVIEHWLDSDTSESNCALDSVQAIISKLRNPYFLLFIYIGTYEHERILLNTLKSSGKNLKCYIVIAQRQE